MNCAAPTAHRLRLGDVLRGNSLGVQVLERTRFDAATSDEVIDLGLLQSNDPAKSIGGQLPLIDQSIESSRREPKSRCRLFGGKPVAICMRHANEHSTLSAPLSLSRAVERAGPDRTREQGNNTRGGVR